MCAFAFGLIFGSFGNVVIWRFPRGESLSTPGSHCPVCDTAIAWYDNVPVLSWMLLRGRCRACGTKISARYPAVELLTGVLWLLAAIQFGPTVQAGFCAAFFYLLVLLAFIDLDIKRLPNPLVGLLALIGAVGVGLSLFGIPAAPLIGPGGGVLSNPAAFAVAGSLSSAGLVLFIALAYQKVRGVDGFGMGDVKLLGAIGLFLGPYALLTLFIGSLIGAVYGLISARTSPDGLRNTFPFGPALAASAVIVTFVGVPLVAWYLHILTF
ncbi:MAG: prepilin peptidase [Coriobacteriia bacterium]|nr:prepilin peptidase [Coriobacteriia bacterium]